MDSGFQTEQEGRQDQTGCDEREHYTIQLLGCTRRRGFHGHGKWLFFSSDLRS